MRARSRCAALLALLGLLALFRPAAAQDARAPVVASLTIDGNRALRGDRLGALMNTRQTPWYDWLPGVRTVRFNLGLLQTDLIRIRSAYADLGYLDATVDTVIDRSRPDRVSITFLIREGPVVVVDTVRVDGLGEILVPSAHPERLRTRAGRPMQRPWIDADREDLVSDLRNAGMGFAAVAVRSEVDRATHRATVVFDATPGPLCRFGETVVRGHRRVEEGTVRRGLTFRPGAPFRQNVLRDSRRQLYLSGAFRSVTIDIPDSARPEAVPVFVTVTEREPRTVEIGAAYDTQNEFQGELAWVHRNFLGGARQFRTGANASAIEQALTVSLRQPYVGSSRNWLVARGERVRQEKQVLGIAKNEVNGGLSFERNIRTRTTLLLQAGGGLDFRSDTTFTEFSATFRNDRRDDVLNPHTGLLTSLFARQRGYLFRSDWEFVEVGAEGRWYQPIFWRSVLATRVYGGALLELGDGAVPGIERLFAGGLTSVRGWGLDQLGPRDAQNVPAGGKSKLEGSVELRTEWAALIGTALFVDAGNVALEYDAFVFAELRWAAGAGIRYLSPVGPLRFDAARRLSEDPDAARWQYHVSLGQAF